MLSAEAIALVGAIVGIYLLYTAIRGRRSGETPFCRRCGYDLTGLACNEDASPVRGRCSECGAAIATEDDIVIGKRRIRRARAIAGGLLALFACVYMALSAISVISGTNWIRFAPTSLVLWLGESSHSATAIPAWTDIERRIIAGGLSPSELRAIASAGLRMQTRPFEWLMRNSLPVDLLGTPTIKRVLTPSQHDQLLRACYQNLELRVRSPIRQGRRCPVRIDAEARVPKNVYAQLSVDQVEIDGRGTNSNGPTMSIFGCSKGVLAFSIPSLPSGDPTVTVTCVIKEYAQQPMAGPPVRTSRPVKLSAKVTVLPRDADDGVRGVSNPALDARMALALEHVYVLRSAIGVRTDPETRQPVEYNRLTGCFRAAAGLPVACAFEVYAISNEWSSRIGSLQCRPALDSPFPYNSAGSTVVKHAIPDRLDLILIPSPEVARDSIDIFTYWDRALLFENVPVRNQYPMERGSVRPQFIDIESARSRIRQ